MYILIIY